MTRPRASELPRFNHVALSVAADLLTHESQLDLVDFYSEVFGWTEMPGMSKAGELLVLRVHSNEQFVYLSASESPMHCPELDHFGLSVPTPAAIEAVHGRVVACQDKHPAASVTEIAVQDFKVLELRSFYVRYRLPLSIELQCFTWREGLDAQSLPDI